VSHLHIQRLVSIRNEYESVQASITYTQRVWAKLVDEGEFEGLKFKDIQKTANYLGDTYIIRLFAEFEAILRDYLPPRAGHTDRRAIFDLINRVALRHHIPDPIRDKAHTIREYRNLLAHRNATGARTIVFSMALSYLNQFLAPLP